MTSKDTAEKLRAVFLTAMMVLSVFTIGVASLGGSAAANVPGGDSTGNAGIANDNTPDTKRDNKQITRIADVVHSSDGGVTSINVTINQTKVVADGAGLVNLTSDTNDATNLSVNDVDWIEVRLIDEDTSSVVAKQRQTYNEWYEEINFGSGSDADASSKIDRVQILAKWSDDAQNNDFIDAAYRTKDDGTVWPGSFYGTLNSQQLNNSLDGRVSAEVNSLQQGTIANAKVWFINDDTGLNITQPIFTTDSNGNTQSIKVPTGVNYTAKATKAGFTSDFEESIFITQDSPNGRITITLEAIAIPKTLEVVKTIPSPPEADADNKDTITYVVQARGQLGDKGTGGPSTWVPLENIDIQGVATETQPTVNWEEPQDGTSPFPGLSGEPEFENTTENQTIMNQFWPGVTTFTVKSPDVHTNIFNFSAESNRSATAEEFGRFGNVGGQGYVKGKVFNTKSTSGLQDARVWATTCERFHQNSVYFNVNIDAFDSDNVTFFRVRNDTTGELLENDEYRVQVWFDTGSQRLADESPSSLGQGGDAPDLCGGEDEEDGKNFNFEREEAVGLIDKMNVTDDSVGQGFFAADKDLDGRVSFLITPLKAGQYNINVSRTAPNNSLLRNTNYNIGGKLGDVGDKNNPQENFFTPAPSLTPHFTPAQNLTSDKAQNLSNPKMGPNLWDDTNEAGYYLLKRLFTNGTSGVFYTVIAEKAGFDRDFGDVLVRQDGNYEFVDEDDEVLELEPRDVTPLVNITNIARLPNASVNIANPRDPSSYSQYNFSDQTDKFPQTVPRDGKTVDVILVKTPAEEQPSTLVNGTVQLELRDDDDATPTDADSFEGKYIATAGDGGVVSTPNADEDTLTIYTGSDGKEIVWLQSDKTAQDLDSPGFIDFCDDDNAQFAHLTATVTTNTDATDLSCKNYAGITQTASISGFVTNPDNVKITDALAWTATIDLQGPLQFSLSPVPSSKPANSYRYQKIYVNRTAGGPFKSVVVPTTKLANGNYLFRSGTVVDTGPGANNNPIFQNVVAPTGFDGWKLVAFTGENNEDAEYTLSPVPAKAAPAGLPNTGDDYRVNGIELNKGETGFGAAIVAVGSTDDANIVIDTKFPANFQVTNLRINPPGSANKGTTIDVTADIQNKGVTLSTQTVELVVDGQVEKSKQVQLGGFDSTTTTFNYDTSGLSTGSHTIEIRTANDSESTSYQIDQPQLSVLEAVAQLGGDSNKIEFSEVQQAIAWWSSGATVPGTGGKTIDFQTLQTIIAKWSSGATI